MNLNVQNERRGLICGCVEHEPPASFTAEEDDRKLPPNPLSSAPCKWRFTLGTRMEEVLARSAFHGNKHGVIVPTQEIGHLSNATKQALNRWWPKSQCRDKTLSLWNVEKGWLCRTQTPLTEAPRPTGLRLNWWLDSDKTLLTHYPEELAWATYQPNESKTSALNCLLVMLHFEPPSHLIFVVYHWKLLFVYWSSSY